MGLRASPIIVNTCQTRAGMGVLYCDIYGSIDPSVCGSKLKPNRDVLSSKTS